jgi:DNA anti-recombination protein RmuC
VSDFFGALTAGGIVADTLFIQRMGDFLRDQRADGALLAQHAGLATHTHQLQANYNRLVDRYNALARSSEELASRASRRIAELEGQLVEADLARQRAEAEAAYERANAAMKQELAEHGKKAPFAD